MINEIGVVVALVGALWVPESLEVARLRSEVRMPVCGDEPRLLLRSPRIEDSLSAFRFDVKEGLSAARKWLPCRYLYDARGSELFEKICGLEEYYLSRAEAEILEARADEIVSLSPRGASLLELGSGSSRKTRLLIEGFLRSQGSLRYLPVDIARSMLEESCLRLMADYPALTIEALAGDYQDGMRLLRAESRRPKLILWLGSTLGNLHRPDAAALLEGLACRSSPEDRFLVGIDLRKDRRTLELAYDDHQGVTARFNLNLLQRINRELGGRFEPATFHHCAFYHQEEGRVEMHLVSDRSQRVAIEALGFEAYFATGEPIHTENSYKYSPQEIEELGRASRLRLERTWLDSGRRFSLNLFSCPAA
jgi:L-histidine N-alpha-methyltransferase